MRTLKQKFPYKTETKTSYTSETPDNTAFSGDGKNSPVRKH